MKKRVAVAFTGPSGSGKTSLVEKIAKILIQSKKVAIIKNDPKDKAHFDVKGKDSYILERYIMKKDKILQELEVEQAEYETLDYMAVENQDEEIASFKATVLANVKQKKAINIRALESDIIKIKSKALSKGIPYQTLINSVIHQFANDKLLESK